MRLKALMNNIVTAIDFSPIKTADVSIMQESSFPSIPSSNSDKMQSLRKKISIHEEIKIKATLDKQTNGDLRLMTKNRFGFKEYRIFKTEKRLDKYLLKNPTIDIWKIKDNRERKRAKTIYKYYNGEEIDTYHDKKNLYNAISALAQHGIFSIRDESKVTKYFQKKSGWFYRNFEKTNNEEAEKIFLEKERLNAVWMKVYALGIIALASGSILSAAKEKLSKAWDNKPRMFPINLQNNILPTLTSSISSNQFLTTALTAYCINTLYGQNMMPTVALITALSFTKPTQAIAKPTQAKLCQPQLISSVKTSSPADAVVISGKYAYVSTDNLQVIKIANPANPVFVNSVKNLGGYYLAVSDNYVYVVDGVVFIINIKDPLNPKFVTKCDGVDSADSIAISDHYAYIGAGYGDLQIVNVTDPSNPINISSCPGSGALSSAIVVSGKYAYLSTEDSLRIIDVSNLLKPILASSYPIPGKAMDVAISGKYAYIADGSSGLQIINIEDPFHPTFVSSYSMPNGASCLAFLDDYVFVGDYNNNFQIVNVANPAKPTFAGSLFVPSSGYGIFEIAVLKDYAFLANDNSGFQIVKLNCPSSKRASILTKLIIGGTIGGGILYVVSTGTAIFCIIKKRKKSISAKNEEKPLLVSS